MCKTVRATFVVVLAGDRFHRGSDCSLEDSLGGTDVSQARAAGGLAVVCLTTNGDANLAIQDLRRFGELSKVR